MEKIKIFEAFSGIGSPRMALMKANIDFEVVGISEIDKYAITSYNAIYGESDDINYGDISKINTSSIPDHDLFVYGFPCQDISLTGKQKGLEKNSDTRSSLLWECERIIRAKKPKYLLMENVKNLVSKKFKSYFESWLEILSDLGYTNYWKVLNTKDFGIPQNRERVFCISILGEHEPFEFPKPEELKLKLEDLLEKEVDEKFYLSQKQIDRIKISTYNIGNRRIQEKDWCDALLARDYKDPKCVKVEQIGRMNTSTRDNSQRYRVYATRGLSPTLTTMQGGGLQPCIVENKKDHKETINLIGNTQTNVKNLNNIDAKEFDIMNAFNKKERVRKLTPKECWRLQGFPDWAFEKAENVCSNSQLYKQAGNTITVDVLEKIFEKMF